jgi:hypothetical protein
VPGYPPECEASQVTGYFDRPGTEATATVAHTNCPPAPGQAVKSGWTIQVTYGSPSAGGAWSLSECADVCRAVAAADLNGDGVDELVLEVDEGASTELLEVLALPFVETGPEVVVVEPPGAKGFPKNEPARFPFGGSVTEQGFMTCDMIDGTATVISTSATLNEAQTEYAIIETDLSVTTDGGSRTGYPIAQSFVVQSVDHSNVPFDPNGTEIPVRGTPCWDEG